MDVHFRSSGGSNLSTFPYRQTEIKFHRWWYPPVGLPSLMDTWRILAHSDVAWRHGMVVIPNPSSWQPFHMKWPPPGPCVVVRVVYCRPAGMRDFSSGTAWKLVLARIYPSRRTRLRYPDKCWHVSHVFLINGTRIYQRFSPPFSLAVGR